ncbi:MAG: autotransporter outer membrane beta-barrel domain-containing protein [Proteobacteria bacterium]|nr:autotransporter outer membrane beta-barrel domain-containing protein [Pseudomonadota bacterium]
MQSIKSAFTELSTSSQIAAYTNIYNNVLQTSSGCAGIGTYPNVNQTSLNNCTADMTSALAAAGYSTPGALMGGVAALSKAMGAPLAIPGTSVTVAMPAPTAPTTTVAATTTTTKAASTTTSASTTTTSGSTTTTKSTTTTTQRNAEKEAAAAATTAISAQVQRATTIQQAVTIINVLSSIANPRATTGPQRVAIGQSKGGMAAGSAPTPWNGWMNLSRSKIANTYQNLLVGVDTRFDGDVDNWIGGIDYSMDKNLVVGVSVGYDKTAIDTLFNNGNITSKGFMVAPYVSYQINEMFSVDAVIGYADGDSDINRNFRATTGKQDFTRNFGAVNLSAIKWFDSLQLTGKLSYIAAEEKLKDFTDSSNLLTSGQNNRLEQLRLGAQLGYWSNGFMPYIGLTYINDVSAPNSIAGISNGRDAYSAALGLNIFGKDVMGSLSYSTERGRSQSKNNVFMGSLSYRF